MHGEISKLVESINSEAGGIESDPVLTVRKLWNWRRSKEDCDIEIKLGPYTDMLAVLDVIRESPRWTVRFMDTGDPQPASESHVNLSLIFHEPQPDPDGTLRFAEL